MPGPTMQFLIPTEQAIELAHAILEAVEDWKKKHQH